MSDGLYLTPADGSVIEGIHGAIVVKRNGRDVLEIWDEDAESILGHLPALMTPDQINAALRLYRKGYEDGKEMGSIETQIRIRNALGIA